MTSIRSILKPSAPQLVRVPVRLMAGARSASFQCGAAERCSAVVPLAHSSRLVLLETDRTQPRIFSTEGGVGYRLLVEEPTTMGPGGDPSRRGGQSRDRAGNEPFLRDVQRIRTPKRISMIASCALL